MIRKRPKEKVQEESGESVYGTRPFHWILLGDGKGTKCYDEQMSTVHILIRKVKNKSENKRMSNVAIPECQMLPSLLIFLYVCPSTFMVISNIYFSSLDIIEMKTQKNQFESPAIWVYIMTYLNYVVLTIFGWFRDLLRFYGIEKTLGKWFTS